MDNLELLLKKNSFYFNLKKVIDYISQVINVVGLFLGLIVLKISDLKIIISLSAIYILIDMFLFINFRLFKKIDIPSPYKILNIVSAWSLLIYCAFNINKVLIYVEIYLGIGLFAFVIRKLISSKIEDLLDKIVVFSTPLHEVGHYIANENYKLFKSVAIDLVPNSSSLGRMELESNGITKINTDNYLSFLMAGNIATSLLLYNETVSRADLVDILKSELKAVKLTDSDKQQIMDIIDDRYGLYNIREQTIDLIKSQKDKIISLTNQIYNKNRVACDDLTV